jgi:hypothetical protein
MNITLKIIRTIDSARNERATPIKYNILDAYKHALKNKIGLLYLESLDKAGMLPNELKPELELQNEKLRKSLITVKRVAAVLNKARVNYVVYKSLMPFPATLNDVDMLVLDPNEGFRRASTALLRNSFDLIAQAPLETLFHDRREQKHGDPEGKDVYDVDLYNEIGASYIISIDKRKLATSKKKTTILGEEVNTLAPEADLLVTLVHAIYPEQLYTLQHYYASLYYLNSMDDDALYNFVRTVVGNHAVLPIMQTLSLAASIQLKTTGRIDNNLLKVMCMLRFEAKGLDANFTLPVHFTVVDVLKMLANKVMERKVVTGLLNQSVRMLNPALANHVVTQMIFRARRETF